MQSLHNCKGAPETFALLLCSRRKPSSPLWRSLSYRCSGLPAVVRGPCMLGHSIDACMTCMQGVDLTGIIKSADGDNVDS